MGGDGVSWSDPTVYKSEPSSFPEDTVCSTSYKMVIIANQTQPKSTCVISGRNVSFGFYAEASYYRYVVGFKNDSKMYPLQIYGMRDIVSYSASQDVLIMKQVVPIPYGFFTSMGLYKDFSKIVVRSDNFMTSGAYTISKSEPDYVYTSDDGSPWLVVGIKLSTNGNWIVLQLSYGGIAVFDLKKFEGGKRLSTRAYIYGRGMDPYIQFAISNDGKYVAIVGSNVDPSILTVDSSCGPYSGGNGGDLLLNSCETTRISTISSIPDFVSGWAPKFNEDGSELSFTGLSNSSGWRSIVLRVKGYVAPKIDYIALGDSYSSGEGELQDANYLDGTNVEYEKCHVSNRSYAFRLSYTLGLNPRFTKNVACSGAVVEDLVGDDGSYWGQSDRLFNLVNNKNNDDKLRLQASSVDGFLPGRVRQESFVKTYNPNIITVGIGGNDIGFAQKLTACLGPNTCSWAEDGEAKEKAAVEIKNLFDTLVFAYQELHNSAPDSKIYAVGYPKLVDPNGRCGLLTGLLLNDKERQFIDEGVVYLNQIIEAAAKKVGIKYINIESSLGSHVLCGSSPDSAINFIKTGDDIGPFENSKWFRLIGQESFHPNALGHQLESDAILSQVAGNLMTYNYCYGVSLCPQNITAPEPSSYWIPDLYHNYPEQKNTNYVADDVNPINDKQKQLSLANNSLAPNSVVDIVITSTPQSLGQFVAASDGSFNTSIELPADLEEGYHTVHLYGTSYAGSPIELYQVIKYMKPIVEEAQPPAVTETVVDNTVVLSNKTDKIIDIDGASIKDLSLSNSVSKTGTLGWISTTKSVDSVVDSKLINKTNDVVDKTNSSSPYALIVFTCVVSVAIGMVIIIRLFKG